MLRVVAALARRALADAGRRPQFLAPLVVFPTLLLSVNVGGLSRTTDLPGFPEVHGFLDFQLAAAITQSLLLGGISTGIASALDIEGGFFDRLVAAPIPRAAIVLGRLAAAAVSRWASACGSWCSGSSSARTSRGGAGGVAVVLPSG